MDKTQSNSTQQFTFNVFTNLGVMGLNIIVGLWFTPYLIDNLGVASYGIVILAVSLTSYLSIFNNAIDNSIGRFLTIDISINRTAAANKTFNTSFWPSLLLLSLLMPAIVLFSIYSPQMFNVPVGQENATRWLFAFVLGSYLFVIIRSSFTAPAFAYNRLDLKNLVFAGTIIIRVTVVVILFTVLATPVVWHVGAATFIGAAISLIMAIYICRRLAPFLAIRWQAFDIPKLKSMFGMSGWLIINQVGSLLFLNIDLIVVNAYLGIEAQGRYGSVLQWSILLRTLGDSIATALTPIVLSQYAQRRMSRLAYTTRQAVRLLGMLMALPIGLVMSLSASILTIWLGADFSDLAIVLTVMAGHLCVNIAVRPLFSLQVAFNKVKWPGLVTVTLGIANVILAILLVEWGPNGLGVAVAGALILTFKNSVFTPLYGAHIQKLPWYTFLLDLMPSIVGTSIVFGLGTLIESYYVLDSWLDLASAVTGVGIVYLFFFGILVWRNEAWQNLFFSLLNRTNRK